MRGKQILLLCCLLVCSCYALGQKTLQNKLYHYVLIAPDSLIETTESGNDTEKTYYDNVSGVILMITGREGIFRNTEGYMSCSKQNLERELKDYQGDSTLILISCENSKYYTEEVAILHFETKMLAEGFNRCMIYFVHHKNKEIQFSFMYDKADDKAGMAYIDKIMKTLQLP
jgi:hypothetical protein